MYLDNDRKKRICIHEAGHYIVARELSFTTLGIDVTLSLSQGNLGQSELVLWSPNITDISGLICYLKRRIMVLYAGAIAEAMDIMGNYDSKLALYEWKSGGSVNDFAKAKELIHILRNIMYPETTDESIAQNEINQIDTDLIQQAGGLVSIRIELIHDIGNMLFEKVTEYDVKYELLEGEINKIERIKELYLNR